MNINGIEFPLIVEIAIGEQSGAKELASLRATCTHYRALIDSTPTLATKLGLPPFLSLNSITSNKNPSFDAKIVYIVNTVLKAMPEGEHLRSAQAFICSSKIVPAQMADFHQKALDAAKHCGDDEGWMQYGVLQAALPSNPELAKVLARENRDPSFRVLSICELQKNRVEELENGLEKLSLSDGDDVQVALESAENIDKQNARNRAYKALGEAFLRLDIGEKISKQHKKVSVCFDIAKRAGSQQGDLLKVLVEAEKLVPNQGERFFKAIFIELKKAGSDKAREVFDERIKAITDEKLLHELVCELKGLDIDMAAEVAWLGKNEYQHARRLLMILDDSNFEKYPEKANILLKSLSYYVEKMKSIEFRAYFLLEVAMLYIRRANNHAARRHIFDAEALTRGITSPLRYRYLANIADKLEYIDGEKNKALLIAKKVATTMAPGVSDDHLEAIRSLKRAFPASARSLMVKGLHLANTKDEIDSLIKLAKDPQLNEKSAVASLVDHIMSVNGLSQDDLRSIAALLECQDPVLRAASIAIFKRIIKSGLEQGDENDIKSSASILSLIHPHIGGGLYQRLYEKKGDIKYLLQIIDAASPSVRLAILEYLVDKEIEKESPSASALIMIIVKLQEFFAPKK